MSWNTFSFAGSGNASLNSGIAAVSRVPNSMELWSVNNDGFVQDHYFYDGPGWNNFQLAPAQSASPSGGIAVLSRVPNGIELWFVGSDGSVQDHYWYDGPGWNGFQLAPAGSASLTSGMAALSRIPNSMELWFIGQDGSIQDHYWYDGPGWNSFQLAPAGSASVTSGIAALSRIPNSMELWWVGQDGSVQGAYWYQGATWQRYQLAPPGSASLTSGIAALSRIPNSMELWWIGPDGSVQGADWYQGGNWQRYQLAPAGSAALSTGIAAVSRVPDAMEVWFVGQDNSIQDCYWYAGANWQRFELAAPASASSKSGLAVVSRVPNSMELWVVSADGSSLRDQYWYQDPVPLPALSSSNNSTLISGCKSLANPTVTFNVTQDLVTVGDTGFSLQLNSYPQTTSTIQGQTLNWLQYIIYVGGPTNNNLGWEVQYWSIGAQPFGPNQPWPPGYTPNPPNSTPWLPALPQDFQVLPFGPAPSNRILAGSVMKIQLATDTNGLVTNASFSVTDPHGKVSPANFPFPSNAQFPIYGFQVDLVGPGGLAACNFISGAGTLNYSVSSGTLAIQGTNTCGGPQPGTGETSNAVYGSITSIPGSPLTQSVNHIWQGIAAAAGSSLDGYWGRDNSQHVNYVTPDGHVHELYIHPGANWVDNDLTAFSKGSVAAAGSAIDGYWGTDNSQHVNFISTDGHVHELYTHPTAGWVDNDLTAFSKGSVAAPGSALDAYWGTDSSQHVNFISVDGHIHELYIQPGAANWVDNNLTAMANGAVAAPGSAIDAYWGTDSSQHVNFISVDGHVHELYIHPGAGWVDNDLTAMANGALAAPGSPLDAYWGTDSSQHVNFISLDGHIHELYTHPGAGWVDNDLTAISRGTAAAPGSPLAAYWGTDSSQHVNFISLDGHVHELYTSPAAANWADNDLTAMSRGAVAALARSNSNGRSQTQARGSALHAYWGTDNSQHVNFVTAAGHVHELYIRPGAAWVDFDLSANT